MSQRHLRPGQRAILTEAPALDVATAEVVFEDCCSIENSELTT